MRDYILLGFVYLITVLRLGQSLLPQVKSANYRSPLDLPIFLGLAGILLTHFLCSLSYVTSRSMQPTLEVHDCVLVDHAAYRLGRPWRGEIALFLPPSPKLGSGVLIKRIVAIEGDLVALRSGTLYLNGDVVSEPYGAEAHSDFPEHRVKERSVFVMGDNRNNSVDSRAFGDVSELLLLGRAELRIWPWQKFGPLPGPTQETNAVQVEWPGHE